MTTRYDREFNYFLSQEKERLKSLEEKIKEKYPPGLRERVKLGPYVCPETNCPNRGEELLWYFVDGIAPKKSKRLCPDCYDYKKRMGQL